MSCPCGTEKSYSDCCEPFITGKAHAPTPETLMRSRYSAYVKCVPAYLRDTLAPASRGDFSEKDVREWAKQSEWLGLNVMKAQGDTVEFTAKYKAEGKVLEHHEVATFKKHQGRWFFVDGDSHVHEEGKGHEEHAPIKPHVRTEPKVGRNDPCHCGSGKKFKKCHAA